MRLQPHRRPGLLMFNTSDPSKRSQIGGYPLWPTDMQWPRTEDSADVFVAQIDLAELPFRPEGFPEHGMLYIFLEDYETKVYFATNERELAPTRPPEPFRHKYAYREVPEGFSETIPAGLDRLPMSRLCGVTFTDHYAEKLELNYHEATQEEVEYLGKMYQEEQEELETAYRAFGRTPRTDRIGWYEDEIQGHDRQTCFRQRGEDGQEWDDWPPVWGSIESALRDSRKYLRSSKSASFAEPSIAKTFGDLAQWMDRAITMGWSTPMEAKDHEQFIRFKRESRELHLRAIRELLAAQKSHPNSSVDHHDAIRALEMDGRWQWAIARLLLDDPEKAHLIERTKQAEIIGPVGIYARMFGFGSPHTNRGNEWRDHLLLFEFSGWMQPFGCPADFVKTWMTTHALVPNEWQDTVSDFECT